MDNLFNSGISIEKMAAFLDGNLSASEMQKVSTIVSSNDDLRNFVSVSGQIDKNIKDHHEDYNIPSDFLSDELEIPDIEVINNNPMLAVAACTDADNLCDICCEGYILRHFGITVSDDILQQESLSAGWLTSEGTQLQYIGKLSELHGLNVERRYHATLEDIARALSQGAMVMACIDEGELTGNLEQEKMEDIMIGKCPDHVVIISSVDKDKQHVSIIDPYTLHLSDFYPIDQFEDAWEDSEKYMISVYRKNYAY